MKIADLGSIIHGTLREVDLLEAFADCLEALDDGDDYDQLIQDARDAAEHIEESDQDYAPDETADILAELQDALSEAAPPYAYFGTHEGDGSDFGFWLSESALGDAIHDGELLRVSDLSEVPAGHNGEVLVVNDHGNCTLYAPTVAYKQVWAVV